MPPAFRRLTLASPMTLPLHAYPHAPAALVPPCACGSSQLYRYAAFHAAAKRWRLEGLPRPSDMAEPATWQDVQQQNGYDPIFKCFRPGGTPAAAALPVGLYTPVLDQVAAMFAKVSGRQIDW